MTSPDRKYSAYMEWAKTRQQARFNLATSGLTNVPVTQFPLDAQVLEVTGPGGYGYAPLQQRIASHTGAPEECVVAAAGTSMANHLAMAAVLDPGDEVLIELPTYSLLVDVARYLGATIKRFDRQIEADFAVDLDAIQSQITSKTRLLVLSNLHNPSSALTPAETMRAIGEIAVQAQARVLVDEVYLEMLFDHAARSSFFIGEKMSAPNPFVATNSLTKVYGLSGLRCGWVLASAELAKRMWQLNDLFGVNAAHPAELMSVMAFDHLHRFRDRAKALLDTNRPLLNEFLDSRADLECFRSAAGTVVFPRMIDGDTPAFVELLRNKYQTTVAPGTFFGAPNHFRIGIGIDTAELCGGLERLGAALDHFTKP